MLKNAYSCFVYYFSNKKIVKLAPLLVKVKTAVSLCKYRKTAVEKSKIFLGLQIVLQQKQNAFGKIVIQ